MSVLLDILSSVGMWEAVLRIATPLIWSLSRGETAILDFERGATVSADLLPGDYLVSVLRPEDEASAEMTFAQGEAPQTVTLALPALLPPASLEAADSAPAGSTLPVTWDGPDAQNDYISVARPGDDGYETYAYTRKGSPAELLLPALPGDYELRYVLSDGRKTLATRPIAVTEVTASLDAADSVVAGAQLPVTWQGPDYANDYISVARPGDDGYESYVYTRKGSPGQLLMPPLPGDYELRYVMSQDRTVLATRRVTVTEVTATLASEDSALAGATLPVTWEGPDYANDYISIARLGDDGYENYAYTRKGSPAQVVMPTVPGDYELRYVMSQDRTVLASLPIEVQDVQATLALPETARAGAPIVVNWEGPGYDRDYISLSRPGDSRHDAYSYTRTGSPLLLRTPAVPGTYEVRYVAASNGTSVLARKEITLTEVSADLQTAERGAAGGNLAVHWDGPDFSDDYVSIARAQSSDDEYETYGRTSQDSPLILKLPEQPGAYELRYVVGQNRKVIARKPLTVE